MDPCHRLRPSARRSFIFTPYRADQDGRLRPQVPGRCIAGASEKEARCVVRIHHWRKRKTGPEYPLVVAECTTHGTAFTLYPPGFVPYGRVAIVPVDAEGELVSRHQSGDGVSQDEQDGDESEGDGALPQPQQSTGFRRGAWELTLWGAAQDASEGHLWSHAETAPGALGSLRTQGRRIVMAAGVLGLLGQEPNCPLVGPLGIPALMHSDATSAYQRADSYQARGRAVMMPLAELAPAGCGLLERVLWAGSVAGFWGNAWRWDADRHRLREVVARARSP
jgi:hypothetical protein